MHNMQHNIQSPSSSIHSTSSASSPSKPHFRSSISYTDEDSSLFRDLEKLDDGFMLDLESNKKDNKKSNNHVMLNNILMSVLMILAVFCLGLGISGYIGSLNFNPSPPNVGLHTDNYAPNLVMADYFRENQQQQQVMAIETRKEIDHELKNGVERGKQLTNMNNVIDAKLSKLKANSEADQEVSPLTEGESIKSKQELLSIFKVSKITLVVDDYISDMYEKLLKTISEEPIMFNLKKHPDYELLRSYLISNFDLEDPQSDFPLLFVNSKLVLKGGKMKSLTTSEINEAVQQYL